MKVSYCKKCEHYRRKTWVQSYKPAAYHEIGFSHAYGYCEHYKDRCSNVRHCDKEVEE